MLGENEILEIFNIQSFNIFALSIGRSTKFILDKSTL